MQITGNKTLDERTVKLANRISRRLSQELCAKTKCMTKWMNKGERCRVWHYGTTAFPIKRLFR